MKKGRFLLWARALRVNQWIKNLVVFTAIIFSGKLFEADLILVTLFAFFVFCILSSASYLLNDIIDYPYDIKHPLKRFRPVAAGEISVAQATFVVFLLTLFALIISLFFSISFFLICLAFILLHIFYSLYLKKQPVLDIFAISFSFMLRTFAGEIVSGWHIPIWLLLTIFFISLFMAAVKRHAELVVHGRETRESLYRYKEHFIDFLTYTFATATIIAYSTYTYSPEANAVSTQLFAHIFPTFETRKLMMITIPLVVYGIARYSQLLYEKAEGERPEQLITTDVPLITTILLWGVIVISLIYII